MGVHPAGTSWHLSTPPAKAPFSPNGLLSSPSLPPALSGNGVVLRRPHRVKPRRELAAPIRLS